MSHGSKRIAFGIMGGWNQSQAHAQFVSNVVDHGMNIQAALEAARFTKLTFEGCDVITGGSRARTGAHGRSRSRATTSIVQGGFSSMVGGGQSVMRDADAGVNYGASDPRKDGAAIPEPLPLRASHMSDRTRWIQLVLGVICMVVISSPQYVWALFTTPMTAALGVDLAQLAGDVLAVDRAADVPVSVPGIPRRSVRTARAAVGGSAS